MVQTIAIHPFSYFPLLPMSNDTEVHQCCLTPAEIKSMSSLKHFPPSALYFSPLYTSYVYYIFSFVKHFITTAHCCQSATHRHWYVFIPQIIYFKTVTAPIYFRTELLHTTSYSLLFCSWYKYSYILPISPYSRALSRHYGGARVESRLVNV